MTISPTELRRRQPELGSDAFSHRAAELFGRSVRQRVAVRLHGRDLDRQLAAGENPADCDWLALRAAQLTTPCSRRQVANDLDGLVRGAADPINFGHIAPFRRAVSANAERLAALAEWLRGDRPVYVAGVARLVWLLRDGTGPLYTDRHGAGLALALDEAERRLSE